MPVAVELPSLGESVVEGTVSRWLVKEGDRVAVDQPLVEVTTDKVDAEIPAPVAGIVQKILVAEGQTVAVGAPLVMIEADAGSDAPRKPASAPRRRRQRAPQAAPPPAAPPREAPPATPLARRLAEEAKVDLRGVTGTGAAGRVTKQDVAQHASEQPPAGGRVRRPRPPPPRRLSELQPPAGRSRGSDDPAAPTRRRAHGALEAREPARRHGGRDRHVGRVAGARRAQAHASSRTTASGSRSCPSSCTPRVRALREFPRLNASVLEDAIVEKKDIHIGIAVETEKGLVVPVARHADRLSLAGLAQALEDLANRARTKRLSADELKGGSFTISNPGRFGNLYGFAIINQPQVGILRMGEIVKRPVVRTLDGEDAIVIRPIMHLALSYDHRAVDGAPANGFLHRIRELLEEAEFDL